jgi:proline iminopeptidase
MTEDATKLYGAAQVKRYQVQDEVFPARARTVEGEERERLWEKANEVWPHHAEYQTRTDRVIPVVLERAA